MNEKRIDINTVTYIAKLSRLRLNNEEKVILVSQINDILQYVDKLNELDTSSVQPMSHVLDLKNVFRMDEINPSLPAETVVSLATDSENNLFSVPRIIEE